MKPLLDFADRTVLVVGGSSGIGNGIARTFRQLGAMVYVWGTRQHASDYADEPGSHLDGLNYKQLNVTDDAAVANFQPPFPALDVLVLSQGAVRYRRAEFEIQGFRAVVGVNLISVMSCAMKFQPMLAASKGSLIIVSSTAAFESTRGNPAYNASKTGAYGLTRTLGQAWAPLGIRVNGVAPGMVETKLTRVTTEDAARRKAFLERIPMGRFGTPEDMGNVAAFLASPLASYIVGQTVIVDGGTLL